MRSGDIVLDDFEYRAIQMTWVTVGQREQWLSRAMTASQRKPGGDHDGYLPQPYEQLAEAYRRAGDDHAARRIQLAKYRQRNRVTGWRRWYSKLWNFMQDGVIGYGYRRCAPPVADRAVRDRSGAVPLRGQAVPDSQRAPHLHAERLGGYTLDLLLPTSALQERQVWQSANGLGEVAASGLVVSAGFSPPPCSPRPPACCSGTDAVARRQREVST